MALSHALAFSTPSVRAGRGGRVSLGGHQRVRAPKQTSNFSTSQYESPLSRHFQTSFVGVPAVSGYTAEHRAGPFAALPNPSKRTLYELGILLWIGKCRYVSWGTERSVYMAIANGGCQ